MSMKQIVQCDICGRMCNLPGAEVDIGAFGLPRSDGSYYFKETSFYSLSDVELKDFRHICMECVHEITKIGNIHWPEGPTGVLS